MNKYFEEDIRIKLSDYLEVCEDEEKHVIDYIISCIGDVIISKSLIETYVYIFHSYGGRYSVRRDRKTIIGLYKFYLKFPKLSYKALEELSFKYIYDLFESYSLDSILEKLIEVYGETDEAFELFICYIERKADELQKYYKKEASRLSEYREEYYMEDTSELFQFISYLYDLVVCEHIPVDSIIDSLPSPELIKKDAKHLGEMARYYRCHMGIGYPISYLMTKSLAKGEDLSSYGEEPSYYIDIGSQKIEKATITTQEFLDSVQKEKTKRLIKKR